MIKEIKIPCIWANGEGVAIFKIGVGPCGRFAAKIETVSSDQGFNVIQTCIDPAGREKPMQKTFFYQWRHITGRIEMTEGEDSI